MHHIRLPDFQDLVDGVPIYMNSCLLLFAPVRIHCQHFSYDS